MSCTNSGFIIRIVLRSSFLFCSTSKLLSNWAIVFDSKYAIGVLIESTSLSSNNILIGSLWVESSARIKNVSTWYPFVFFALLIVKTFLSSPYFFDTILNRFSSESQY